MPRAKITKREVDRLPLDRETWLWDTEVRGFGVRARDGGAKVYFVSHGTGRRQQDRRVTIGRHGAPWTPETARQEARRLLGLVATGQDVAGNRAALRALPTVAEFSERFLTEYATPYKRPSSVAADESLLARVIVPRLGPVRLDKLTRADVAALHHARRDTPTDANRALALLSKMLAWAEALGLRAPGSNPCRGVPRYRETRRERYLSVAELARLGRALREAETGRLVALSFQAEDRGQAEARAKGAPLEPLPTVPVDPFAVAAIRLLLFTGARRSEILGATWVDVDLSAGTLRVPLPKEGRPKLLRLTAPALEVLAGLPRFESNPFVIVAARGPGRRKAARGAVETREEQAPAPLSDIEAPWRRIRRRAGLEDVRLHDLRHSFASVAVGGGASLPLIGALLGHTQPATTARYAHLSDDPLRALADHTAARIAAALRSSEPGRAEATAVVPLQGRQGQK